MAILSRSTRASLALAPIIGCLVFMSMAVARTTAATAEEPKTAQEICKRLSVAKSKDDDEAGTAILKMYKRANDLGIYATESWFDTPRLKGGRTAKLFIKQDLKKSDYAIYVARKDPAKKDSADRIGIDEVNEIGETKSPPRPAGIEITLDVPETSTFIGFENLDVMVVLCSRQPDKLDEKVPALVVATQSGTVTSHYFSALITLLVAGTLYLASGYAKPPRGTWFFNPLKITAGITGRASLSNLQFFMFTLLVVGLLVYVVVRTGVLVEISDSVAWLLGVVGAGSTLAKFSVPLRERLSGANVSWLRERGWLPLRPAPGDLIKDGDEIAIERLQGLAFGIVVFIALLLQGTSNLAEFTVPQSILTILAASQALYIGGGLARSTAGAGDARAQQQQTQKAPLDEVVTKARMTYAAWQSALATNAPAADQQRLESEYKGAATEAVNQINSTLGLTVDPARI